MCNLVVFQKQNNNSQVQSSHMTHMVPTSEYQIMASAASPPPVDSDHKKDAARWFREVLDPESDKFIDSKPNTPCFTPGTTTLDMVKRTEYKRMQSEHVAWAKHGKDGCDGTYGDHYRMPDGTIDPDNYIVLGRAHNSYLQASEELMREKIRTLTAQSKHQNKVSVSGVFKKGGYGYLYILAAPDGDRKAFLKAEAAHKANHNLLQWCKEAKNKNKGEDDYTPSTTTISNALTAIEVVIDLLDAGWSAATLDTFFRGCGRITGSDMVRLNTLLSEKDALGEDTLMTLTWRQHFPKAGPTGNKFAFVKENITASIKAFEQRTNPAEDITVTTKRALDIATAAGASTKRARLDDIVEVVDSD